MEQPTDLVKRPLSPDDPDDRIRMVFGLTGDDGLPMADEQRQRNFFDYLNTHLSFPFKADYYPASDLGPSKAGKVTILGFADPPLDRKEGVVCNARRGKNEFQVPLVGLQVKEDNPNSQYIGDYTYWLWEVQDFVEEEDLAESPYSIGSVVYYGPDDKTTTKIVAGVFKKDRAEPIMKRWVASDVTTNPKVQKEIDQFFKKHGITRVGISAGNIGCPHEEGKDFPVGGDCPFCPWWKGKQGSGARE
jgi:hypothetical protein